MARRLEHPHLATRILILGDEVANEISGIALGLEADHVVLQQQRDELLVVGQGRQHLRRRHRDMKEEADPVGMAAAAQRVRDRDEVIVMDPDQVVGFDDLFEFGREMIVHPHVSGEIAPRELGEIEPEMQDRPQHPVGEAVVVFLVVLLGEIGDHIGDVLVADRVHLDIRASARPCRSSRTTRRRCAPTPAATRLRGRRHAWRCLRWGRSPDLKRRLAAPKSILPAARQPHRGEYQPGHGIGLGKIAP